MRASVHSISTFSLLLVAVAPVHAQQAQPTDPTAASQATYNQIVAAAQQVAQIAADPGISVDIKTQQITTLASQFNQSVATWQQQIVAAPAAAPTPAQTMATAPVVTDPGATGIAASPPNAAGVPAPTPVTPPPPTAAAPALSPTGGTGAATLSVDQVRTQIGVLSQQMATVARDPSIPSDAKAAQLSGLSTQFNQLVAQLQQLGG
jgi:hypothetical protein